VGQLDTGILQTQQGGRVCVLGRGEAACRGWCGSPSGVGTTYFLVGRQLTNISRCRVCFIKHLASSPSPAYQCITCSTGHPNGCLCLCVGGGGDPECVVASLKQDTTDIVTGRRAESHTAGWSRELAAFSSSQLCLILPSLQSHCRQYPRLGVIILGREGSPSVTMPIVKAEVAVTW